MNLTQTEIEEQLDNLRQQKEQQWATFNATLGAIQILEHLLTTYTTFAPAPSNKHVQESADALAEH